MVLAVELLTEDLFEMGPPVPYEILARLGVGWRNEVSMWEDELLRLRRDVARHVKGWVHLSRRLEGLESITEAANR